MNSLIARYSRAPRYAWSAAIAAGGALFSGWMGLQWTPCFLAAALFALTAVAVAILAARPAVEIFDQHLAIGAWTIPWSEITEVDYSGWLVPLMVRLTLVGGDRKVLLFPGDKESGTALLRLIRRMSCAAHLDGLTYQEFWGDTLQLPASSLGSFNREKMQPRGSRTGEASGKATKDSPSKSSANKSSGNNAKGDTAAAPTRYPMLRPEDELEVEQMYQRLKSVGHLESRDSQE
jgi:hypothetical protein